MMQGITIFLILLCTLLLFSVFVYALASVAMLLPPRKSQKLMRFRIALQAGILALSAFLSFILWW